MFRLLIYKWKEVIMLIMLIDVDDEESPLLCGIPYPGSTSAYQVSVILASRSTHSGRVQRVYCTLSVLDPISHGNHVLGSDF